MKIWGREKESRHDKHERSNTYLISPSPSLSVCVRACLCVCVSHFMWVHMCMHVLKGQKSFSVVLYLTCWAIFHWTQSSLIQLDLLPSKPQGFFRSPFLQCWGYTHSTTPSFLHECWTSELKISCLHSKQLIKPSPQRHYCHGPASTITPLARIGAWGFWNISKEHEDTWKIIRTETIKSTRRAFQWILKSLHLFFQMFLYPDTDKGRK